MTSQIQVRHLGGHGFEVIESVSVDASKVFSHGSLTKNSLMTLHGSLTKTPLTTLLVLTLS